MRPVNADSDNEIKRLAQRIVIEVFDHDREHDRDVAALGQKEGTGGKEEVEEEVKESDDEEEEIEEDEDVFPAPEPESDDTKEATCLPPSLSISARQFRDVALPETGDPRKAMEDCFTGKLEGFPQHDWRDEIASLQSVWPRGQTDGCAGPPALSVWQAAGYKLAQHVLARQHAKGALYWWTPGSGKSIMVALLLELLAPAAIQDNKKIIVVSTPQNISQNGLKECLKALLKFSPSHVAAQVTPERVSALAAKLRPAVQQAHFLSFRRFYTWARDKDMRNVCLIIDECHELYNDKLAARADIYRLAAAAHKIFLLSGTPWRNPLELQQQLGLLHAGASGASQVADDIIRRLAEGCVSHVDGTKDCSNYPISGGWRVERCGMSQTQLFNFATRCSNKLSKSTSKSEPEGLRSPSHMASLITDETRCKQQREALFTACRITQGAAGEQWGSPASGLCQLLGTGPRATSQHDRRESVGQFAPKFAKLCAALLGHTDALDTKHFVYSAHQGTITHLGATLRQIRSVAGKHVFRQFEAHDFEWIGGCARPGYLRVKADKAVDMEGVVGFVILQGTMEEKKKLKAAFGYVTPGGERFDGLERGCAGPGADSTPIVQVLLGSRETNQGLTFLRIQEIHIMEPNPRGWGQILQTIGRGIRRGTHLGITDTRKLTVKTTIYVSTIDDSRLEAERDQQMAEARGQISEQLKDFQSMYLALQKVVRDRDLAADPSKERKKFWADSQKHLKQNLKILAKNVQKLAADLAKLEDGWLRVPKGCPVSTSVGTQEREAFVKMWRLLPDEAILNVTYSEQADRAKFDNLVKEAAVDSLLLRTFHGSASSESEETCAYLISLRERFAQALAQKFALDASWMPVVGQTISEQHAESVCGLKWEISGAERPAQGRELINPELEAALKNSKTEFTEQECKSLGVSDLHNDDFIKAGDSYFTPADCSAVLVAKKALKCSVCGETRAKLKPKKKPSGVTCSRGHFTCSACYFAAASGDQVLSPDQVKQILHSELAEDGRVPCSGFKCCVQATEDSEAHVRYPEYWQTKYDQPHDQEDQDARSKRIFVPCPYMVGPFQLIRQSAQHKKGCDGKDGESKGLHEAVVTRVLRVENGPVWHKYWQRKQKMMAGLYGLQQKIIADLRRCISEKQREVEDLEVSAPCKCGNTQECCCGGVAEVVEARSKLDQLKLNLESEESELSTETELSARSTKLFGKLFHPYTQLSQEVNELFLFHGTRESSANAIGLHGFDLSRANLAGLYGGGTYHADSSCKSVHYCTDHTGSEKVFLVCRVLMGRVFCADGALAGYKEPPEREAEDGSIKRYDSVFAQEKVAMGKKQNHNEYITYHSDQVYPEYLVYFTIP